MKRFFTLSILAVFTALFALWLSSPRISALARQDGGAFHSVSLPWQFDGRSDEARLLLTLTAPPFGLAGRWQIVPDEELLSVRVNGQPVSIDHIPLQARRDWSRGFALDLGLQAGRNEIEFTIRNEGGPGGLQLHFYPAASVLLLLWLAGAFALFALHSLLPLSWSQRAILLLALIPLLAYWSGTPWTVRSHDVAGAGGHFGYVQWIADHLSLPRPDAGWTFYHPPLYYIAAALVVRVADGVGVDRAMLLQLFSMALWLVFLVATAAALRRILRGRQSGLAVATLALALWPAGVIHSIRIGNDAAAYAFCGLLGYCLILWWKTRNRQALIGMGIFTLLALLSKTSVLAIVAVAGLLVFWRALRAVRRTGLLAGWPVLWMVICTLAGLVLSMARNIYYYSRGELSGWLVGNEAGLSDALHVPVSLKAFLPLDIPTFLTTPWASAWDDASGRANFWNYLLRSALTGEFSLGGSGAAALAYLMGAALLALCIVMALRLTHVRQRLTGLYRRGPLILLLLFWIASLIALRIKAPYSCSNDFRYIVPVLLPFLYFAVRAGGLARGLLIVISLASFGLFVAG